MTNCTTCNDPADEVGPMNSRGECRGCALCIDCNIDRDGFPGRRCELCADIHERIERFNKAQVDREYSYEFALDVWKDGRS